MNWEARALLLCNERRVLHFFLPEYSYSISLTEDEMFKWFKEGADVSNLGLVAFGMYGYLSGIFFYSEGMGIFTYAVLSGLLFTLYLLS